MGILRYVEGVGLLALVVLPLLLISRAAHHTWLGNISGPTGVLVEIVVAISLFIAGSELIGLAGLFSITALIIVFWLVAVAVGLRLGWSVFASPPRGDEGRQSTPTLLRLVCLATMVVVATDWIARTASTLEHGFFDVDTLWYHLPFAARFAQGSLWHIPYVSADPLLPGADTASLGTTSGVVNFYPANASIFHAAGLLAFGRDVLSPVLNVGWFALLLLAAYCVGAARRAGWPAAMAGVLVAALPVLAATQSGTAKDDLLGLSLFTAAAAFALSVPREPRLHVMAGVASGVALGTKLSFAPPVAALAVSSIALGPVRKAFAAWMWTTGILATGSFWYFRNWFQTGSPLPLLHLGALGLPGAKVPSLEANKQSVAHYLFDGAIWKHAFLPGIRSAIGIGAIWPVVPLIAVAGTVLALMRGDRLERALGLTAFVSAVAYVFLPQSAGGPEGHPYLFGGGLRYVTPALTLGVLLAAVMTWRLTTRRTVHIGLAATMGTIAIASAVSSPGSSSRYTAVAAIVACVALLPLAFSKWARQIAIVLVGCTLIFGWPLTRHYLLLRYSIGPYFQPLQPIFVWSQTVRNSRIAIAGFQEHYPLYGPDGSNRVEYLGVRAPNGTFRPPANCREWSRALHRGHYDYLVLTTYLFPFAPRVPSPAFHWTAYPRIARRYTNRAPGTAIFRLDRRGGVVACR